MTTDPEKADIREEPENEADSTPEEKTERSVEDELEEILADYRKKDPKAEPKKPTETDSERLERLERRDKQRVEQETQAEIRDRLANTVKEIIKANPELKRIGDKAVRGYLIDDLYSDSALFAAFSDNRGSIKKIAQNLAKRYGADIPAEKDRDDTESVLAEVRGVSTTAPRAQDETDFAQKASSDEFWKKYGNVLTGT